MGLSRFVAAASVAVVLGLVTWAAAPAAAAAQSQLSEQDRAYLVAVNQANQAEIAAGTAAWNSSTTEMVREWGALLIADHRRLDADVVETAQAVGVELPGAPSAEQQQQLAAVAAQTGAALDAAWIAAQITAHEQLLAVSQQQVAEGTSPRVVAVAASTVPVLQAHLAMLRSQGVAPSMVDSGTGGQAGSKGPDAWPLVLLTSGVLLAAVSIVRLRRAVA